MFKKIKNFSCLFCFVLFLSMLSTSSNTASATNGIDLTNPAFDFDKILFLKHDYNHGGLGSDGNHMVFQYLGHNAANTAGGGIYILNNAFSGAPTVTNVLANSLVTNGPYMGQKLLAGSFSSMDLSYDGTQILFSYVAKTNSDGSQYYRTWTPDTSFHIFKVNVDGTGLTQLTQGSWNEYQPCWLPDGTVAFISERRGGFGRCHGTAAPTAVLTTMNADGSNIRIISYHETNEWWPSVDNNGMIIWTRWDYVDRGDTQQHAAWITSPDGYDARPLSGNYSNYTNNPKMLMQLRAIPNSNKIVGVGAPHHQQTYGPIVIIDPDIEDDDNVSQITNITPDCGYPESTVDLYQDQKYATPYPLSEEYFLCVYGPNVNTQGEYKHYGLYAIDCFGNKVQLYDDPTISCLQPIPLRARPVPNAIPVSANPIGAAPDGIVSLINVYDSLLPFPTGTNIVALRILQVYPKTTPVYDDPKTDYAPRKNTRGVLGTVPVEADGSANFYLPANKPVFFQALAADGTAVQTMRSDAFVIGGQSRLMCQGCHEPRHEAAVNPESTPLALRRVPSTITPETAVGSKPMTFSVLIQPVLDSKCISCHNGSRTPDLRKGNPAPKGFYTSYINLQSYVSASVFYDYMWSYPRSKPGNIGAKVTPLYTRLKNGHGSLTNDELHRFVLWLDSGTAPFYGDYLNTNAQLNGQLVQPSLE